MRHRNYLHGQRADEPWRLRGFTEVLQTAVLRGGAETPEPRDAPPCASALLACAALRCSALLCLLCSYPCERWRRVPALAQECAKNCAVSWRVRLHKVPPSLGGKTRSVSNNLDLHEPCLKSCHQLGFHIIRKLERRKLARLLHHPRRVAKQLYVLCLFAEVVTAQISEVRGGEVYRQHDRRLE